jgi:serine/threonine-protein kinase SRK2
MPSPRPGLPDATHFGLEDTHVVLDVLGRGGEGSAWLMREIKTNKLCAVKLIKRPVPKVLMPFLLQEISIQAQLGRQHENIIDLEGIMLTPHFVAIILEYASGGPLTRYICERAQSQHQQQDSSNSSSNNASASNKQGKKGGQERPSSPSPSPNNRSLFLSEQEALYFFKQFISAVEFCHDNGFAHRDLKLDNTLLDFNSPPTIKISDFGFAKGSAEENTFTTIGTPCYMSPEVLTTGTTKKGYNAKRADVWACGVLLFAMLFGTFPFDSTDHDPNSITTVHDILEQQLASLAKEQKWKLPGVDLDLLSSQCQDLLRRIFTIDPAKRIAIGEIKKHPWYNQELSGVFRERLKQISEKQKEKDKLYNEEGHYFPPFFKERMSEIVNRASKAPEGKEAVQSIWLI